MEIYTPTKTIVLHEKMAMPDSQSQPYPWKLCLNKNDWDINVYKLIISIVVSLQNNWTKQVPI